MNIPLWAVILTSAGVGALISSILTLLGQRFERKARREELLFTKATEMAISHGQFLYEVAEKRQIPLNVVDPALNVEMYYKWLKHILEHGALPNDLPPDAKKYIEDLRSHKI